MNTPAPLTSEPSIGAVPTTRSATYSAASSLWPHFLTGQAEQPVRI